nr:unnamed protein product [Haemonchus contortus]
MHHMKTPLKTVRLIPHKPGSKPAVNINTIGEKNEDVKSEVVTKNGTEPSEANGEKETAETSTGASEPFSTTPSEEEGPSSTTPVSSSHAGEDVTTEGREEGTTTAGEEGTRPTTAGPIEASGEEPAVSNKVPNVAANVDEEAATTSPETSEETTTVGEEVTKPTTAGPIEASGEEPAVSNKVPNVAANVDEEAATTSSETSEETTTVGEEGTRPTTAGPIEASGEEPAVSNKVPNVAANVDEEAATTSSETSEETTTVGEEGTRPTTAGPIEASGEEPAVSNKVPNVAANVDEETNPAVTGTDKPLSSTPSEEELLISSSTATSTISKVTEAGEYTTAERDQSTTSEPVEASGELPTSVDNKVPDVAANIDEKASTGESIPSAFSSTASSADDLLSSTTREPPSFVTERSDETPAVVAESGHFATTSSNVEVEKDHTSAATTPSLPHDASVTENATEATTAGPAEKEEEEPHVSVKAVEGSGEEQSHKDNAPQVETSMDKHTTVADERSTTSQPESSTKIASELGGSVKTKANGTGTEDDEEDSIINPAILEHPHDSNLPANVGFVPSSEPDLLHESREQEEEESEKAVSPKEPDYEDTVKAKTPASAAVTEETTTLAHQSTTTEPPIQLVQDLIDALAGGGLNAIFGPPRRPSEADEADKKLGDLKKYLHKSLEQKRECPATRQMRFVASELTDLTTPFDADTVVYSLQHCAKLCFETGCSTAFFTRYPRPICMMRFSGDMECHSNGTLTTSWNFTRIQEVVRLDCIECDKQHGEIIKQKEQVDITNLNSFSEDDENTVVPTHEGVTSKCEGRIEFQTLPVGSLPPLNVTNDVPARTPADCAKKCFESKGCSLAGFIGSPSGNISHGVCLLTSDISVCGNNADYVPQHAALNPFVISCMKCSSCTYNIRTVTPDRVLPDFNHVESVSSIGECARACHSRRCTMAQYNSQQHTCMTTSEPLDSKCARETAVVTEGILPVTLECVSCVI